MRQSAFRPRVSAAALCLAVLFGALPSAHACLWDEDTLAMEKRAFPTALELITGRFPRHGEDYYRWRVADRQKRVDAGTATLEDLDDLAVAHEKLGDPEKAIEIMRTAETKEPNRYRSVANLGTFLIHAGRLEEGLKEIRRAIEINPDAHFGREIYQALLVEYVLSKRKDGQLPLPMWRPEKPTAHPQGGFGAFVLERKGLAGKDADEGEQAEEIQRAVKGVLGMMRFGNHASPVLLEALGDLLLYGETDRGHEGPARRLATRAFLVAARRLEGDARAAYREKARLALGIQRSDDPSVMSMRLEPVEEALEKELAAAETLRAKVLADEKRWVESGDDPSARFAETYLGKAPSAPKAATADDADPSSPAFTFAWIAGGLLLLALVVLSTTRRRRR